ncbi:MAG: HAD hydrolase family protein [Ruminococcus sp.]|nr:HAD hydrolase family protein [Ruminococcus sp.]
MTDAGIYYDENGNEYKKFCTRDAAGFWALKQAGIKVIVVTGRECEATRRRMTELGVDSLFQNIKNKKEFLEKYITENNIDKETLAYIGDDLNDLPSMSLCGFKLTPIDACSEIKRIADYISPIEGGRGVVRDVAEYVLKARNIWEQIITEVYGIGV